MNFSFFRNRNNSKEPKWHFPDREGWETDEKASGVDKFSENPPIATWNAYGNYKFRRCGKSGGDKKKIRIPGWIHNWDKKQGRIKLLHNSIINSFH